MARRTQRVRSAVIAIVLATVGSITAGNEAWAQTSTWTGAGADSNWSTAANWMGNTAPSNGNSLVFPPNAARMASNNNIDNLSVNEIEITGSGYTLSGNALTITDSTPATPFLTVGTAVSGSITLSMPLLLGNDQRQIQVASGATLILTGQVTASNLEKDGTGTLELHANNAIQNFTAGTASGVTIARNSGALGTAGTATINANSTVRFAVATSNNKVFDIRGNGPNPEDPGALIFEQGASTLNARVQADEANEDVKVTVLSGATLTLSGGIDLGRDWTFQVDGSAQVGAVPNRNQQFGIVKTGSGSLTLITTNDYLGETEIQAGTLAGTGSPGPHTATGLSPKTISPGVPGTAAGILRSGNLTMDSATTFAVQVNGPTPGTQHDQIDVTGAVALNNAGLSVSGTLPGTPVVIIRNDGSDPVSGIFAGLPQGATVLVGGAMATISYIGGDGNDVVLNAAAGAPIVISPTALPNGTVGVSYSQTLTASGGAPPYTGSTSGTLPPGLTIAQMVGPSAIITGTPKQAGTYNFTVIATDTQSRTGSQQYTVIIAAAPTPPTITVAPPTLPGGTVGTAYAQTISASGGTDPYTFAVTAGTLPAGLALNPTTGVLSGSPTTAGPSNFTITATDSASNTGSQAYSVTISAGPQPPPPVTLSPTTLPGGTVGVPYSQTVTASGGVGPPYTGAVSSGSLPPGLTGMVVTGASATISGTPTQAGTFAFTVIATDTQSSQGSQQYTVTIDAAPTGIVISPPTLPNGTVATPYSQAVTASGGTGPYTYAVTAGTLPAGVTLNTGSGLVSGTPTTAGTSSFTVTATDSASNTGSQAYSVTISAGPQPPSPITLSPMTLPGGTVGVPYSQAVTPSGGIGPPYTGAVSSGSLPPGLTGMVVTGASATISGTPTQAGSFTFTATAVDGAKNTGSQTYTIVIQAAPVTIVVSPPSLPNGVVNMAYSQTITATGGTGPYTFAVTTGTLPAGLTLDNAAGVINGTPTGATTANFTITATDANGSTGRRAYALTITAVPTPPITVTPTTLPGGTVGAPYAQTVTASGGAGSPYTLSVTSGTLPTGLTFTSGLLSGTPAIAGSYTFTVTAVDLTQNTGSQAYTVVIQSGGTPTPITIGPDLPNQVVVGQPGQIPLSASGGDGGPYTFAITGGALPAGLSMTTAGVISGTPTTPGQYSFTVTATDASGRTGSRSYSITVVATPVPVLPWWLLLALSYFAIRLAMSRVRNRAVQ